MARQTIRDIAKQAGVSPSTVSFVINNRPGVCEETRRKVQKILDETNFTPNLSSRRLVLKRSYNICLLFGSAFSPFRDMFFWVLSRCMLEGLRKHGYNLVMNETFSEDDIPDCVHQQDVDGVICFLGISDTLRSALREREIPYVIVDATSPAESDAYVRCDYCQAAQAIVEFLYARGLRDIGLVCSNVSPEYFTNFYTGYERGMRALGLAIRPEAIRLGAMDIPSARSAALEILNGPRRPDAIIGNSDILAVGALKACREKGLRVPDDISVIGVDDLPISECTDPGLTTLRVDPAQMAAEAVSIILSLIGGAAAPSVTLPLPRIVERGSVRG